MAAKKAEPTASREETLVEALERAARELQRLREKLEQRGLISTERSRHGR